MDTDQHIIALRGQTGNITSYVIGYAGSIALTLAAYMLVARHVASDHEYLSHASLIAIVVALALAQLVTQFVFFLHLGKKGASGWNLIAFLYAALLVIFLAGGSLWIMHHLNYNMMLMPPAQVDAYMVSQ